MAKMIFHHPCLVSPKGVSGSQVRPIKMINAFKSIGYEVDVVMGYGAERKEQINAIKKKVLNGRRYDFIYSESSTMPTLLTEKNHIPKYPWLDFGFFRWANNSEIPIGLFYRDIHWKFSQYKIGVSICKRAITLPMYWYDWFRYLQLVDHLFLPSMGMKNVLPTDWPKNKISALPPGADDICTGYKSSSSRGKNFFKLFYVGGVEPPLYDLTPLFKTLSNMENIQLILCCRPEEWNKVSGIYDIDNFNNIKIVHESGERLKEYYLSTDVFTLLRDKNSYLDFAMPVKIFEAMSYALPVITFGGTEAARFISDEEMGWVVNNIDEACKTLEWLRDHPQEIKNKKNKIYEIRERHSWQARARQVANTLVGVKKQ